MTTETKQTLGSLLDQHHSLRLMRVHLEKQLREINTRLAELEAAICIREIGEQSTNKVGNPITQ